jgi:uncharacterized RDD family membrane protein YckC
MEGVTSSYYYASRGSRLGGQLLDGLITFGPLLLSFAVGAVNETVGGIATIASLLFAVAYYFFADAMPGGQSLGKRAVGTAVISEKTGEPCGVGQSFVRNLLLYILGPIDWVFIFGEKHQRLGDMVAKTIVVDASGGAPARRPEAFMGNVGG